jgi:TolA-binding protein
MGSARLTRRQRLLRRTGALALLLLAGAGGAAWLALRRSPVYRPGDPVEGLTAELARSLPPDYPRVTFTDVSRAAGLTFRHFAGTRSSRIVEDMGSGAAWGDYDRDGWLDLFLVNVAGPVTLSPAELERSPARSALFRNNGDGTFTETTDRAGLLHRGFGMAAAWGDYDNDGWPDLVITAFGENRLYRNNGDGTFSDRSQASGLGGRAGFWSGAAWGDYDRDGFLDLYITGYVQADRRTAAFRSSQYDVENPASLNPASFPPLRNLLYHNERNGTFREVAAAAGVLDSTGRGLAATWTDFDEDGWPDLYVANDVSDNALFRNRGDGTFAEVSRPARVADYRSSMGIAVGDWDGDGDQDLFLTHWIAQENALYSNQLDPRSGARPAAPLAFQDEADRYGLGQIALDFVGWGTSFFDYDNDGRLDLFVVNGSTLQQRADPSRLVPMRDQLFWNRGPEAGFYDVSAVAGPYFQEAFVGRGAAVADYDNDGDLDFVIVNHGGPAVLLRNDGGNRRHWLAVELRGTRSNRQAIGAKLRLVTGGTSQVRQVGAQASYLSQNSLIEHFGLGDREQADTLDVVWPSGIRQSLGPIPADRRIVVTEAATPEPGKPSAEPPSPDRARLAEFWVRYRSATALRLAHRLEEAAREYARALELQPRHEDALYYLGSVRFATGDFPAAREAWERLIATNPRSARAHSRLGALSLCPEAGPWFDPVRAEAEFRTAHEINREETGPLLRLGQAALFRGDSAAARRHFTAVLGGHAGSADARFYLGFLEWSAGRLDQARQAFARAARSPPASRLPAGATGEGDTGASGSSRGAAPEPCSAADRIAADLASLRDQDLDREMTTRYRALATLIANARNRPR